MRPTTLLALVPLTALAATLLPATPVQAAPADRYAGSARAATNVARVRHDLPRLRTSPCLTRFAERQARRMATRQEMFHQDLQPVLDRCGLRMTGENVAYGYRTGASAVRDGWMLSEGHRDNLLNPPYRLIGIGAERDGDGTWYVAQVFGRSA